MKLNPKWTLPILLTTMAALATPIAIKSLTALNSLAAAQQASTPIDRTSTADAPWKAVGIVPAQVIDQRTELFVGTGDASNGSWVRP